MYSQDKESMKYLSKIVWVNLMDQDTTINYHDHRTTEFKYSL